MMQEYVLQDIPESDVEMVKADFRSDNCTDIHAEAQPNGLWTVKAMCPVEEEPPC